MACLRPTLAQFHGMLGWPKPYSQPFRDLLAHRKLVPYLNAILGPGFRMDHSPFMLTAVSGYRGDPGGGMAVHGGGTQGDHGTDAFGAAHYRYANGEMRAGMLVCSFQLADMTEGDGGFGCIPVRGSSMSFCSHSLLSCVFRRSRAPTKPTTHCLVRFCTPRHKM